RKDHHKIRLGFSSKGPAAFTLTGELQSGLVGLRPQDLALRVALDWPGRGSGRLSIQSDLLRAGEETSVSARLDAGSAELASFTPDSPEGASGQLDVTLEG